MRGAEQGMISSMIRWISCWLGFMFFTLPLLAENQGQDAGALYLDARKLAMGEGCQIDMIRSRELYRKAADLGDPRALAWKARNIFKGRHGFSKNEAEARRIFQKIEPRLREMGSKKEKDALGSLCRTLATIEPKTRGQEAFELAKKNAINGKASDWETLGWFLDDGIGVVKDEKKGFEWYRKAAEAGSSWGQKYLGYDYVNGIGVGEDCALALSWYRKSAAQGNEMAMGGVAWCYEKGEGVAKDEKEALRWYRQAVDKGDVWSMGQMARMYEDGRGTEKNPTEAFRWWNRQMEEGDFWAPENVARCHANGIGTPKNPEEAVRWYGKVRAKLEEETKKNEAWVWENLGRFYFNGLGVEKDYAKALECYHKAANLKSGWAMEQIGWCYEKGFGVKADEKEALQWYLKAAETGQTWSMGQCAIFYEEGKGTEKNPAEAFRWWNRKAEKGDFWALGNVARCYANGIGTPKNPEEAAKWYGKAQVKLEEETKKNEAWVWENLGKYYFNGLGVEKDYAKALECYHKAEDLKSGWAMEQIGWRYEKGFGVQADEKEALQWYLKAAEAGQAWSMGQLARMYEEGRGTDKNPTEAFRWWNRQDEAGDFWAPENVARCHANGIGTPKNPVEAKKWYGKVLAKLEEETKKNEAWPWDNLGRFYFNGLGVEKDYAKALECYRKAADLKSGWAMEQIGWCCEKGLGVDKNEREAVHWYKKAWGNGQSWSIRQVGLMYEDGRGVEKDLKYAFSSYQSAAEKGDLWSMNRIGWCLANGIGVEKDYKKAFEWYRKAADKQNSDALGNVGWCYETGNGVTKDENGALKWYIQAAKKQNTWAQKRLMAMGGSALLEKNYFLASKCFEAAESFAVKGAAEELYKLDVQYRKFWDGAEPRRGILAKRKAAKGEENENSETARLAGELLSFGYSIEAAKMVQEAIANARWGTPDQELAGWYALEGFCEMAEPEVDRTALASNQAKGWRRWCKPEFAQVGLALFNCKVANPQLGLDVSFVSDFISPSDPRRWASLFMAQLGWGINLCQEQTTGWHGRLTRTATASPKKGIDYLWATQNLKNLGKAKESFKKATKLFPNFPAWAGLAMIARQEGDAAGQEKAVEEIKNILTENAIRDAANVSKATEKNAGKKESEQAKAEKGKARRNKMFEELTNTGKLPWGNEKGELSFGFGYGSGSGLFHGGLLSIGAKLFIPFFLYVKPDWLMLVYEMCIGSGTLSSYQLIPLYEQLAERPSTRTKAVRRLVQIHRHFENKEEALRWAICAAEESPQDIHTLQTAAWVAQWAGKSEKAQDFSRKIAQENEKARSESVYSAQDEYLLIYQNINEADRHFRAKEVEKARHLYDRCLYGLETIKKRNPTWEPSIIRYRIKYLKQKLDEIDLRGGDE